MATFVLVHGAWTDAYSWKHVADRLTHVDHTVHVVDLPGHGTDTTDPATISLQDYTDATIAAAEASDGPVVLVGHSMGGTVISSVAEQRPELVERLVYVAAFLLPSGQSLYGFTQESPGMATSKLGPALRPGDAELGVDPDQARDVFLADADDDTAAAALAGLRPDPLAPLGTPIAVTDANWGSIPRAYIHTSLDNAVTLASQEEMVDAVGAGLIETIDTGHFPMLVKPAELTDLIVSSSTH